MNRPPDTNVRAAGRSEVPKFSESAPEPTLGGAARARTRRPSLRRHWQGRNDGDAPQLDRLFPNNVSFFVAFTAERLSLTPNHLSVASGAIGATVFAVAFLLSSDERTLALVSLYLLAQLAFILDCADGQLARATDTTSAFGAFLDSGIDLPCRALMFGGVFAYLFRHFHGAGDLRFANFVLAVGFVFLLAGQARLSVNLLYRQRYADRDGGFAMSAWRRALSGVVIELMGTQVSLLLILVVIASPGVGLAAYTMQSILLTTAYFRYFVRAARIERRTPSAAGRDARADLGRAPPTSEVAVIAPVDLPGAKFRFKGDEHGQLSFAGKPCPLDIGDKVAFYPSHCDTTVNLHDQFIVTRDGRGADIWEIAARGRFE